MPAINIVGPPCLSVRCAVYSLSHTFYCAWPYVVRFCSLWLQKHFATISFRVASNIHSAIKPKCTLAIMLLTTWTRTSTALAIVRVLLVTIICCISYRSIASANYLEYYRAISAAEEAIVNNQYSEALRLYESTFSRFEYSNPIDCYVAAQIASYVDDSQSCIALLRRGISFGLPINTIAGNPHIAAYIGSSPLSQETTDSCWKVYERRIDRKARVTA